ncbi:MAG: aspartyl protease family protein [Sphingomicrobium sp.]
MRRLSYCLFCTSILPVTAASAQIARPIPYQAVSTPAPVDSTGTSQDVPFKPDYYDRITVKVTVAGQGPYNFLVDTGADHTVISSRIAGSLKLEAAPHVQMYTIAGDQSVRTASVGSLKFSKKTLENVNAAVLEQSNLGADGVLGIDSLRSDRVTFDFPKGLMTIVPSSKVEHREVNRDVVVVTGKLRMGRLVLTDARTGGRAVSVVVDTGSDATIANSALRRSLSGSKLLRPLGPIVLQSVTGHTINGELMSLERLDVGGVTIRNLNIVFAEAPIFKVLKLDERPALLLGMNAIRAFDRVSIDFANRKFRVVLPETGQSAQLMLASR